MHLDALEIARVLTLLANRRSLRRIAHPQEDALAVFRQQVGQRGTEAAAAEHGYGLLLSHDQSMSGRQAAIAALYGATTGRPVRCDTCTLANGLASVNMPPPTESGVRQWLSPCAYRWRPCWVH
ncbi:hypothetical protein D3C81_1845550 [compost metagenome]